MSVRTHPGWMTTARHPAARQSRSMERKRSLSAAFESPYLPRLRREPRRAPTWLEISAIFFLITTQAKRNLSSRSGIGGVRSAT